ncbi:hypothetical protein TUMSATVNIG1_53160 [Vibrio nigripulchritudo]|nr:hypothetical protein VNTUMSATTG_52770 [Vibrio nigripulchritudo]BDU34707.1 hypothetical protein TUMSATVNIG1_53160 [Vibrio nigripulchritudo]
MRGLDFEAYFCFFMCEKCSVKGWTAGITVLLSMVIIREAVKITPFLNDKFNLYCYAISLDEMMY